MGIYDNWRQEYSNAVPTFVPDNSDKVAKYIEDANKRYETTQDYLNVTGEALRTAPVSSKDQDLYNKLNQEVHSKIQELSKRPDLENATREAYKLAESTKTRLSGLVQRQAQEQSYAKNLSDMVEKGKLDEGTKARLLAMSDDKSTETEFDEYGRVLGGFNPVPAAANVDRIEKIQKFLNKVAGEKINVSRSGDGSVKYTNEQGREVKLPENLVLQLKASLELDPEIQAMDSRDAMLSAHEATRGITDEAVLNTLQYSPRTGEDALWQAKIKEAIERGVPPAEAAKQVEYARHLNAINSREMQLALGESYRNITDKQDSGPGVWTLRDDEQRRTQENARAAKELEQEFKPEDPSDWEIKGATANVWGKNGEDILKGTKGLTKDLKKIDEELAYNKSLKANLKPSDNSIDVDAKIIALEAQKKSIEATKGKISSAWTNLLDQASLEVNGLSLSEVRNIMKAGIKKDIKEKQPNSKFTDEQLNKAADAILDRLSTGELESKYNVIPIRSVKGTKVYKPGEYSAGAGEFKGVEIGGIRLNTATADYLNKRIYATDKIRKAYDKAKELATSSVAITTTALPVRDPEKIKSAVASGLSVKSLDTRSDLDLSGVDISKMKVGFYDKDIDKVSVSFTDADGVEQKGWVDMSSSTYKQSEGERLLKKRNTTDRERGKELVMDDNQKYIDAFSPGSGLIKHHPFAKVKDEKGNDVPLTLSYNGESIGVKRTPSGFVFVSLDSQGTPKGIVDIDGQKLHSLETIIRVLRNAELKSKQ